jgi:hypothetical protein
LSRPGIMEWDKTTKRYVYTREPDGAQRASELRERYDIPEDVFEGALERHGSAWRILTARTKA